jgi:hypothetical protein
MLSEVTSNLSQQSPGLVSLLFFLPEESFGPEIKIGLLYIPMLFLAKITKTTD